jgi:hypothetical protein
MNGCDLILGYPIAILNLVHWFGIGWLESDRPPAVDARSGGCGGRYVMR